MESFEILHWSNQRLLLHKHLFLKTLLELGQEHHHLMITKLFYDFSQLLFIVLNKSDEHFNYFAIMLCFLKSWKNFYFLDYSKVYLCYSNWFEVFLYFLHCHRMKTLEHEDFFLAKFKQKVIHHDSQSKKSSYFH